MGLSSGTFSACLLITTGTLASPTAWAELDLATDTFKVPWGKKSTKSAARRARNGSISISDGGQYADEIDLTCEYDEEDATLQVFLDAIESGDTVKVIFCKNKATPESATSGPLTTESYIKGEYNVYDGSEEYSPGKVNTVMLQLRRGPTCAVATRVPAA